MDKIRSKYLDDYTEKPKSKKPKAKKYIGAGLRIVDTDCTLAPVKKVSELPTDDDGPNINMDDPEELPQIVALVDERPQEIKLIEQFRQSNKWKTVADKPTTNNNSDDFTDTQSSSFSSSSKSKSEQRKIRKRYDSDESPPRFRNNKHDSSPPLRDSDRRRVRKNSDSDTSPPRRRQRKNSDSDTSPPRRRQRKNSDSDASPPRQRMRREGPDASPPRRRPDKSNRARSPNPSASSVSSSSRHERENYHRGRERVDTSPPPTHGNKQTKTLDGKKAGLQTAGALKGELEEFRRQENEKFSQMDESVSGRYAKTKVRDRQTGRERDFEAEQEKSREEQQKADERKAQYAKWGKGLKQIEEQQARVSEAIHEMSKPLARHKDDEDLDVYLKQQDREGDPMLKFLTKKREKASNSGPAKPKYTGPPPPPNRFNIPPGYRWDGVDRSNGYEKQWFEKINSRKAFKDEAYKYSVEDM